MCLKRAGLCVSVLLLTLGCSFVPDRGSGPPQKATIRVLVQTVDSALAATIADFHRAYPNYRVETVSYRSGVDDLAERIERGNVDLVPVDHVSKSLVDEGLLLPLDVYVANSGLASGPLLELMEQMRINGVLYDLPVELYPTVMVVNVDHLDAAGIPVPVAGWTWEEFRVSAGTISTGVSYRASGHLVKAWLLDRTGEWSAYSVTDVEVALSFFHDLVYGDGSMAPIPPGNTTASGDTDFENARAAITMLPVTAVAQLGDRFPFKWDAVPVPTLSGTTGPAVTTVGSYGIASSSKNPDVAWELLRFLAGPDSAANMAASGRLPAYQTSDIKRAFMTRQPTPPPGLELLFETTWRLPSRDHNHVGWRRNVELNRLIRGVLSGREPLAEALHAYERAVASFTDAN